MSTQTSGHFAFASWEETTVSEAAADRPKLAHAAVTNDFAGGIEAARTACEYTIVYVTEKTGTFSGMQLLAGKLDGRAGAFVAEERGSFDEAGTVHCTFEVVPGSATGALAGLRGTGRYTARHGEKEIAYTFDYDLTGG